VCRLMRMEHTASNQRMFIEGSLGGRPDTGGGIKEAGPGASVTVDFPFLAGKNKLLPLDY